jgi:pimeloyl-ACP methyl ester carboxylesterase
VFGMRRALLSGLLAAASLTFTASAGATVSLSACAHQPKFRCGVLTVPLDRAGRLPGTIPIHFAVQAHGPKPLLFALSGGPGQSAVSDATDFAIALQPALRHYRLVVLDQRGTGKSGPLICPQLQHLSGVAVITAADVAACAGQIGPRRAFYSSTDSVLDIDALRQALGAGKIALMGVSYGTFVAQQYAQQFPGNVASLLLDSVVPTAGVDPYSLDTYGRIDRVLQSQCAQQRCATITSDPAGDVHALAQKLLAAPLSARVPNAQGRPATVTMPNPGVLANLIVAGDLNPFLQPAIPGAIAAALNGDPAELLRILRVAAGPPTTTTDLSFGLNAATVCEDSPLPFSITATPIADRPALITQGLALAPPAELGPFDAQTVIGLSDAEQCSQWPQDPAVDPVSTAPLPDVPALILSGQLDTRTPLENGAAVAAELPHSTAVVVPGVGHDPLDVDLSGCVVTALRRFYDGDAVGHVCDHARNQVRPYPKPPRSLQSLGSPFGVSGTRGRIVSGVYLTVFDGYTALLEQAAGGFQQLVGGGLRAGRYAGSLTGSLKLVRDSYVAGLRVSGDVRTGTETLFVGAVHVDGPGDLDGVVRFDKNGHISGRIGGRRITGADPTAGAARAAAATGALPTLPSALSSAKLVRRLAVAG